MNSSREQEKLWETIYELAGKEHFSKTSMFPYEKYSTVKKFLEKILKFINEKYGNFSIKILEVGSEPGDYLLRKIFGRLGPIFPEYIAMDIAKPTKKETRYPFKRIKGTVTGIPLKEKSIDLILCGFVFSYVDKKKAAAELKRILKKNGRMILFLHSKKTPLLFKKNELEEDALEQEGELVKKVTVLSEEVRENAFESLKEAESFFKKSGFKVEQSTDFILKRKDSIKLGSEAKKRYKEGHDSFGFGLILKK
ncbi:MAG: class I SAM-dependent methyltransferase [Candidatus Undinarchaeales archaeon]